MNFIYCIINCELSKILIWIFHMCNALHRIGFGLIYLVSLIKDLLHIGSLISYLINYLRMIHLVYQTIYLEIKS